MYIVTHKFLALASFPKHSLKIHIFLISDNTRLNKYFKVLNVSSKIHAFQLPVNYVIWDVHSTSKRAVPEFLLK